MSRPRLEVADIFRRHGAAWRAANEGHLSLGHLCNSDIATSTLRICPRNCPPMFRSSDNVTETLASQAGLEPATPCLEGTERASQINARFDCSLRVHLLIYRWFGAGVILIRCAALAINGDD